jgi:hypothetical protein
MIIDHHANFLLIKKIILALVKKVFNLKSLFVYSSCMLLLLIFINAFNTLLSQINEYPAYFN